MLEVPTRNVRKCYVLALIVDTFVDADECTIDHAREVRKIYELICERIPKKHHECTRYRFENGVWKGTEKESSESCVVM